MHGTCIKKTYYNVFISVVLPHFNKNIENSVDGHQKALHTGTVSAGHQTTYRFFGMRMRETQHGIIWCVTSCCNRILGRTTCHWAYVDG